MKFKKVAVCMLLIFSLCCGSASAEEGDVLTVSTPNYLTVPTLDYVKNHPEFFSAYPDIIGQLGFNLKSFATAKEACRAAKPDSIHTDLMCPTCKLSDKLKYRYHFKQVLKDPTSTIFGVQREYIFFSAYPARLPKRASENLDSMVEFSVLHSFKFAQEHDGTNFVYSSRSLLYNSTVFPSDIPFCYTTNPNGGGDGMSTYNGTWLFGGNSRYGNILMPNQDGTYDPVVDFEHNPVDIEGGDGTATEYDYMVQTILEPYSKYTLERFRNAPAIVEKNDWVQKPHEAYENKLIIKNGDFNGFYFKPVTTGGGNEIAVMKNFYYTYHLYIYDKTSWKKKTVWSSSILKFDSAQPNFEDFISPKLWLQKGMFAIVLDYETNTLSPIRPQDSVFVPKLISQFNPYIVNDYSSVIENNDSQNAGSVTVGGDGNITNSDGSDGGKPDDNGGGIVSDPNAPTVKWNPFESITKFFKSITDGISSFFDSLIVGIESLFSECFDFFDFLGGTFSFIPAEFWTLILAGMSILILLRIFGR